MSLGTSSLAIGHANVSKSQYLQRVIAFGPCDLFAARDCFWSLRSACSRINSVVGVFYNHGTRTNGEGEGEEEHGLRCFEFYLQEGL